MLRLGHDVPDVAPCAGHKGWQSCGQCMGVHAHDWVQAVVAKGLAATRCRRCGARVCGHAGCRERLHHRGPHLNAAGSVVA